LTTVVAFVAPVLMPLVKRGLKFGP